MVSRKPHPAELRERAVQMVFDVRAETGSARVDRPGRPSARHQHRDAPQLGQEGGDRLRQRPGTTTEDKQRIAELEREVRELRRANEILKAASAYFARELDPRLPR